MLENPLRLWDEVSGLNEGYLTDLYERFQADPSSVDAQTRSLFERAGPPPNGAAPSPIGSASNGTLPAATPVAAAQPFRRIPGAPDPFDVAGAVALAQAIRSHGHRAARLDPLGAAPPGDAALDPDTYEIRDEDLAPLPGSIIDGPLGERSPTALDAIRALRETYQGATGYEFDHVSDAAERAWLHGAVETGRFRPPIDPIDGRRLLERLTEVGALERFLQSAFPGQTRFSLEGLGMMVPILDEIIGAAAEAGTRCMFLGMAHRGRLNVLAHTLGKPYEQLIGEFLGRFRRGNVSPSGSGDDGWTGDVKYHLGARRAYRGGREVEMHVVLVPNPSHLEWVNPVVEGMTRACDERRDMPGPAIQDDLSSLAVLIHGDAAFPGQGVVAETLNLSRLSGYRTGGTVHIIANNQIGFTTGPRKGRSTLYASDLAKGFEIPILHVNADDPEACVAAARLAHAYREKFRKDVLIDLIGYRRWGHNEGDEPSFTQPEEYAVIAKHPTVREQWARELVRRGLLTQEEADGMLRAAIERLQAIRQQQMAEKARSDVTNAPTSGLEAGGLAGGLGRPGAAAHVETAVSAGCLEQLNSELYRVPGSFQLHPKLQRPFARRLEVFRSDGEGEPPRIEWAHAETLALATILADGTPIRFTGQDVERGTFSQRHAVLHDAETGERHIPLQSLPAARCAFQVWNSPLSEQATLGFEFGYSVQAPDTLVLWEAQYGDFANVPQAIIDQFIVSARSKWEQRCGLVMLLPHGYEGQGPEHSSARLERYLQMAAEDNLRIANCTTAAQYFHILRRQARLLSLDPRPLVLMTPKSLLRNPLAASPAAELATGRFHPVLPDESPRQDRAAVRRLVLCSGKVYYDLCAAREASEEAVQSIAVVRIEELYPFPATEIAAIVRGYTQLKEVVWLQEEPRNMGAWTYVAPRIRDLLQGQLPLRYVGRTRRASPAEGSHHWHVAEQERLVAAALRGEVETPTDDGPDEAAPIEESVNPEVEHVG